MNPCCLSSDITGMFQSGDGPFNMGIQRVNPKGTLELGGEGEASNWMGRMSIVLLVKVPSPNKSRFQPQGACSRALPFGEEF